MSAAKKVASISVYDYMRGYPYCLDRKKEFERAKAELTENLKRHTAEVADLAFDEYKANMNGVIG